MKTATQAVYHLAFGIRVTTSHTPHALGGDIPANARLHLHQNELALAAVRRVLLENGMGSRARTGERIEDHATKRNTMVYDLLHN